jgi:hypothetical protein
MLAVVLEKSRIFPINIFLIHGHFKPRKPKLKHCATAMKRGQLIPHRIKQSPMPQGRKTRIRRRDKIPACVRKGPIQIKNNRLHTSPIGKRLPFDVTCGNIK